MTRDNSVKLVKSDGTFGVNNNATSTIWPTSSSVASYGSPTDLWGNSWTPADVNSTNFGVGLSATSSTTHPVGNITSIQITVYYTDASNGFNIAFV